MITSIKFRLTITGFKGDQVEGTVEAIDISSGTIIASFANVSSYKGGALIASATASDGGDYVAYQKWQSLPGNSGKSLADFKATLTKKFSEGTCGCFCIKNAVAGNKHALSVAGIDMGKAEIIFKNVYEYDQSGATDAKEYLAPKGVIGSIYESKIYKADYTPMFTTGTTTTSTASVETNTTSTTAHTTTPEVEITGSASDDDLQTLANHTVAVLEKTLGLAFALPNTEEMNRIINTAWVKASGIETFKGFNQYSSFRDYLRAVCMYIRGYGDDGKETIDKVLGKLDHIMQTTEFGVLMECLKTIKPAHIINSKQFIITGATGSGKSTLVDDIIDNHLAINKETNKIEYVEQINTETHRALSKDEAMKISFNPEYDSTTLEATYNAEKGEFNPSSIVCGLNNNTLRVLMVDEFTRGQESALNFLAQLSDNKGYFVTALVKDEEGNPMTVRVPDDFKLILIGNFYEIDGRVCGKIPMFVISRTADAVHVNRLPAVQKLLTEVDTSEEVDKAKVVNLTNQIKKLDINNMLSGYQED